MKLWIIFLSFIGLLGRAEISPVKIFEQNSKEDRNGISLEEAKVICNQYSHYEKHYFIVYCNFIKKNWTETHTATGYTYVPSVLGYVSNVSAGSMSGYARGSATAANRSGYVNAQGSVGLSQSYYHSSSYPVITYTAEPYTYEYTTSESIYGLEVYGLGAITSSTPQHVLFASDKPKSLLGEIRVYETPAKAMKDCSRVIWGLRKNLHYYRASCYAEQNVLNDYRFEIRSQNPFLVDE